MDVRRAADAIDRSLRDEAVPQRAEAERAYLKSDLVHYGTSVPAIRRVSRAFGREYPALGHGPLLELVEELWRRGVHELRMAAVELLVDRPRSLTPDDLPLLERLLREARTWALIDPLAVQVIGPLLEAHPAAGTVLDRWAEDEDQWLRRSVLLAHLSPMRRADTAVFDRFARFADAMLGDREFFIRKAIGWVLRERGKSRPDEVFAWLYERRKRASGLTVREASKYLTDAQRTALTTTSGARRPRRRGGEP